MALRLNGLVVRGELINLKNYSTHGWLQIRGKEQPLLLQLTGNCDPDLQGKHIRFESPEAEKLQEEASEPEDIEFSHLAWQQIGPTGTITARRRVRVADCPPEELYRRSQLGEPPPTEWKPCLYLEWFSQNGRVVLEMVDPVIEFVESDEEELAEEPDASDEPSEGGETQSSHANAPADAESPGDDTIERDEDFAGPFDDEDDDGDPYGLFSEELQEQFDRDAFAVDRAIEDDEDKPDSVREMELMDELIERGEGDIIATIFDEPLKLPRPEQLGDEEVESTLKSLLGQLALYGIALDVCEHYSPRDAYRLLLDQICSEERAYPELRSTQWVQHFMTSEFCQECDAEMQREFEEYERRREQNPDDDPPDDEVPF